MSKGRFGIHGGQYIPETLMNAVIELEEARRGTTTRIPVFPATAACAAL